ncbi:ATP-binding protein [Streptomonospora wellingtoniae]|uniref:NB-ARC domain-containing protein n=1 Tax=Streptomonospora wellingtoniae TaxID=3075544 RepID=A0ABU2KY88_9ACTN|nr:NB-ARC domain-containing protein [Streptomonospora sp. DSM 45055]MDT0304280.1 NB-ARC domain-containing protein [Streptomonospora sp. DSM 45055]
MRTRGDTGRRRGLLLAAASIITGLAGAVTNIVTGQQVILWWLVGLLVVLLAIAAVLAYLSERVPRLDSADAAQDGSTDDPHVREVVHQHSHSYPRARPNTGPVNALPPTLPGFTGRLAELAQLRAHIDADGGNSAKIYAIDGMGGVGKTSLAVRLAYDLGSRFSDGVLFLDMRAHTSGQEPYRPVEAIRALLLQLVEDNSALPAQEEALQARWRAELNSRRLLVLIDNVADADQARPLLAGEGHSALILTSRARLALPGIQAVSLSPPPESDAERMFIDALGDHPAKADSESIADVVRALGNLPLALVLAATWLAHRPMATVTDLRDRLPASQRPVEDMLELSYGELPDELRKFARLIAHHPASVVTPAAAAALADLPLSCATERLEDLYDRHLIEGAERTGQYRLHDLVRSFLLERSARIDTAVQAEQAFARLAHAYCGLAATVERETYAALDRDREGLLLAAERAVERRVMPWAWCLPTAITPYLKMRGLAGTGVHLCTRSLAAMRPVRDLRARAHLQLSLARFAQVVATPREARDELRIARRQALLSLDLKLYLAVAELTKDSSSATGRDGRLPRWLLERLYAWRIRGTAPKDSGHLLMQWSEDLRRNHDLDRARSTLEQALEMLTEAGDLHCGSKVLTSLARMQWHEGAYDHAREFARRAHAYSVHMACRYCTANGEMLLADYQSNGGDQTAEEEYLRSAIAIYTEIEASHRRLGATLKLAELHNRRGDRAAADSTLDLAQSGLRADDWSGQALVRRRRALHAAEAGDSAAALRELTAAFETLAIIEGPDVADDRAHSHLDMAELQRMWGDLAGAHRNAQLALSMLEELEQIGCQVAAHKELADIAEAAGDPAKAEEHRRREHDLREAAFYR